MCFLKFLGAQCEVLDVLLNPMIAAENIEFLQSFSRVFIFVSGVCAIVTIHVNFECGKSNVLHLFGNRTRARIGKRRAFAREKKKRSVRARFCKSDDIFENMFRVRV